MKNDRGNEIRAIMCPRCWRPHIEETLAFPDGTGIKVIECPDIPADSILYSYPVVEKEER